MDGSKSKQATFVLIYFCELRKSITQIFYFITCGLHLEMSTTQTLHQPFTPINTNKSCFPSKKCDRGLYVELFMMAVE